MFTNAALCLLLQMFEYYAFNACETNYNTKDHNASHQLNKLTPLMT